MGCRCFYLCTFKVIIVNNAFENVFCLVLAVTKYFFEFCSGLSPFLDDSLEETTTNILKCDFCFPDEYFENISNEAKDLLSSLLRLRGEDRASAEVSLTSSWFKVSTASYIFENSN